MLQPHFDSWIEKQALPLKEHWTDVAFMEATLAQLQKDLDKFQLSLNVPKVIDPPSEFKQLLLENLSQLLIQLSNESPSLLPQLIYTIDLPENIFHSILKDSVNIHHDLAECILIREAYKVYLRKLLS